MTPLKIEAELPVGVNIGTGTKESISGFSDWSIGLKINWMTKIFQIVPVFLLIGLIALFLFILLVDTEKADFSYFQEYKELLLWFQNGEDSLSSSEITMNKSAEMTTEFVDMGRNDSLSDEDIVEIASLVKDLNSLESIKYFEEELKNDISETSTSAVSSKRDLIYELSLGSLIELCKQWQLVLEKARKDTVHKVLTVNMIMRRKQMEKNRYEEEARNFEEKANSAIELTKPKVEYENHGRDGLPPPDILENIDNAKKFSSKAEEARNKAKSCETESEGMTERLEMLKYQLNNLRREAGMWQKFEREIRKQGTDKFVKRIAIKTCLIVVLLSITAFIIRH